MQHLRIIFYTIFYTYFTHYILYYFILFYICRFKIVNGGIMDELNITLDDLLKKEKEPEPSKKETKEDSGSSIDINKVLELLNKYMEIKARGMQPQQPAPAPRPAQVQQEGQGQKGEVIYNYFVESLQGFKLMGIETIDDALVYCDKNKEQIIKVIESGLKEGGMNGL